MSILEVSVKGMASAKQFIGQFPAQSAAAGRDAVNSGVRFAYAASSRAIRQQVNLSQDYIGSAAAGNRLKIIQRATTDNPTAKIAARQRPVSMARFAVTGSLGGRRGVTVRVKPGRSRKLNTAFLVRLRAGRQITEDKFNIGLVLRLPKGHTLRNRRKDAKPFGNDPRLFLLYGPSVDQVFQNVRDDIEPDVLDHMAKEYLRQLERNLRG